MQLIAWTQQWVQRLLIYWVPAWQADPFPTSLSSRGRVLSPGLLFNRQSYLDSANASFMWTNSKAKIIIKSISVSISSWGEHTPIRKMKLPVSLIWGTCIDIVSSQLYVCHILVSKKCQLQAGTIDLWHKWYTWSLMSHWTKRQHVAYCLLVLVMNLLLFFV